MLKFDERLYEILLVCDGGGKIKKVLYNSIKLGVFPIIGQSIIKLADESSKIPLINTLYNAIDFHQSSNCEINIKIRQKLYLMGIAAKRLDSENLLVGMVSKTNTINMYEDMMKINNESVNELRNLAKEKATKGKGPSCLNELAMCNYLNIINDKKEDNNNFIEIIFNIIDIANFFGAYKKVKVELECENVVLNINRGKDLIIEIFNSLISCILKYAAYNSIIKLGVNEYREASILELQFKQNNVGNDILDDGRYKIIQETIENHQGMIWYEEEDKITKFYIVASNLKS